MNKFLGWAAIIVAIVWFVWGCIWVAKKVSYTLFYEDMVKATVIEMVKPDALK